MTRETEFPGPRTRRTGLRAAALAGVVAAAAAGLSACGTGQINQTAYMAPTVSGVNQTFSVTDGGGVSRGSVSVRDLLVSYNGLEGYKAGGDAPLQVGIFNDTTAELKVTVTAPLAAKSVVFKTGPATKESVPPVPTEPAAPESSTPSPANPKNSASPKAGASQSPKASEPSPEPQPPAGPAAITIPSGQFMVLSPQGGKFLLLQDLTKDVQPGHTVDGITFDFQLTDGLQVVPQPARPAPGASAIPVSCQFESNAAVCRAPVATPVSPVPRVVPSDMEHE